ncbi:hypothetical protein ETAA8_40280 [Anatilimnocola aggregata]|uniref:Uncharacterized protein n=1 Tax=Anatilimnocola aggregata TaxID=2528021 RepID=A0A517YFI5_9BACT|nr:hypothetical protein ETAA8_40280 [Anatilimnocola aggregata]
MTDGATRIWDLATGKTTVGAKAGSYPQRSAIISPDNLRLAIASGGASVEGRNIEESCISMT